VASQRYLTVVCCTDEQAEANGGYDSAPTSNPMPTPSRWQIN
jgi:hypothetical protein